MINDTLQALLPAIYPMLKAVVRADLHADRPHHPQLPADRLAPPAARRQLHRPPAEALLPRRGHEPHPGRTRLPFARRDRYGIILLSSVLIGMGSSIFHPEASRVAHMAAGERHGFAQSLFQVGGNLGSSFGPLLAALIIVPHGQGAILWFTLLALAGIVLLSPGSAAGTGPQPGPLPTAGRPARAATTPAAPQGRRLAPRPDRPHLLEVLLPGQPDQLLHVLPHPALRPLDPGRPVSCSSSSSSRSPRARSSAGRSATASAASTSSGSRSSASRPSRSSLPHVGLAATVVLTVFIGVILASAFSAILVYAQELIPGRVGMIAGLFFGFAFGIGGHRLGRPWTPRRPDQHRVRLQRMRIPAPDRPPDVVPSRSARGQAGAVRGDRGREPGRDRAMKPPRMTQVKPALISRSAETGTDYRIYVDPPAAPGPWARRPPDGRGLHV